MVNRRRHACSPGSKERTRNASKRRVHIVHAPTKAQKQMFKPGAAITRKCLTAIEKQGRQSSWLRSQEKNLAIQKYRPSPRGTVLSGPRLRQSEYGGTEAGRISKFPKSVLLSSRSCYPISSSR